jgi:hypothetical protein
MAAVWWVDLLPWFGSSNSVAFFAQVCSLPLFSPRLSSPHLSSPPAIIIYVPTPSISPPPSLQITRFSLTCSFAGPSALGDIAASYPLLSSPACDPATPGFAYGFVLAYTVAYLGGAALNRESSTYTMLIFVLVTMLTSAFWFIPNTPGERPTVWAVVIALVLSLGGMCLWKYWESKHELGQFDVEDKVVQFNESGYLQLYPTDPTDAFWQHGLNTGGASSNSPRTIGFDSAL